MYRETALGASLQSTLETLEARNGMTPLTERQRDLIWRAFDLAMDDVLQEESAAASSEQKSKRRGAAPPPLSSSSSSRDRQRTLPVLAVDADTSPGSTVPSYRCVDGNWSILLRNPTLHVVVPGSGMPPETVRLDTLRIDAVDPSARITLRKGRGKRPR